MTYRELYKAFEDCERNWKENVKAKSYEEFSTTWSRRSTEQKLGMRLMTDYLDYILYDSLTSKLESYLFQWADKLFYCISSDEKIQTVEERLLFLREFLQKKTLLASPSPSSYLFSISYSRHPQIVFNGLPEKIKDKIIEIGKMELDIAESSMLIDDEMVEFNEYNEAIIEFLYLKTLFSELQIKGISSKKEDSAFDIKFLKNHVVEGSENSPVKKFYLLVFSNPEAQEFFIFCIKNYEERDITKTLLSKYFEFFKNDDFILEAVKLKNYLEFVREEINIPMTRIEPYSSKDISERQEYESMKKSFFSK
ncbi:hypothetical protein VS868_11775 [Salinimicrobium sp. 3283s]|uniref:hypothetical protein n=1 Tax=Salinimicrobium sp. 3283s TaxID=3114359 RepID=UPI0031E98C80